VCVCVCVCARALIASCCTWREKDQEIELYALQHAKRQAGAWVGLRNTGKEDLEGREEAGVQHGCLKAWGPQLQ
jgi:hypothetical protein